MNARRIFAAVSTFINDVANSVRNDLIWIGRIVIAGLLIMLMTGRTSVAEVKFYTVRAAVDVFELGMELYSWMRPWLTLDNIKLVIAAAFVVGLVFNLLKLVVTSIRDAIRNRRNRKNIPALPAVTVWDADQGRFISK